jgi:HK97 family phage major capsid protein
MAVDISQVTPTVELVRWLHGKKLLPLNKAQAVDVRKAVIVAMTTGELTETKLESLLANQEDDDMATTATPSRVFSGNVRVKAPGEAYSSKRWSAKHVKTGLPIFDQDGEEVSRPSQLSLARNGALLKHLARKAGMQVDWGEHDQALLRDTIETQGWASFAGEPHENRIYAPGAIKALIDDSTSGGLEAVPIEFDADIISFPLLHNELLPLVDLKPVSRGRRIEGASISTPTASWGGGDDNTGTLFSTAGMVAAIDTTIFTIDVFIEVGRDFLSDSPVNVGSVLTEIIGERFGAELDSCIADGNGTTQPQGIMQASGTNSVSFSSAAVSIAKQMNLLFAVNKEYRAPNWNFVFGSNETSYQRLRSLTTGISGDVRLAFGMQPEEYMALGRPYKIAHTLANTEVFSGAMKKFRMYRRLGMSVEWATGGKELTRRNMALLAVRGRYGGRVMDANAFAVVSNAEA